MGEILDIYILFIIQRIKNLYIYIFFIKVLKWIIIICLSYVK